MAKFQPKLKAGAKAIGVKKKAFDLALELPQRDNYIIIFIGLAVIVVGYILMGMGDAVSPLSITIAPCVLVLGYCVIVPIGIMYRRKNPAEAKTE